MFQYPCLCIKCLFLYQVNLSNQGDVLVDCFLCILRFILCYMFLCLYASIIPSTQKTFIQKLNRFFVGFDVLCILFLTCITFSLAHDQSKGLNGFGPRGSMGVTSHAPKSVGEREGMNLHTPK
jgi:hypothetical protein